MTAPRRIVYLHGVPGGPAELALFGGAPFAGGDLYAPDRTGDAPRDWDALAAAIDARFAGEPVALVGFSLGAFAALQLAARLGARVTRIDLIAAAAPLESGDYLAAMAGAPVFRAAQGSPRRFAALLRFQALLMRVAPGLLYRMVFAGAAGADRALVGEPGFRGGIRAILAAALRDGAPGYRRELLAYGSPWSAMLAEVTAPVTLWHGTEDNWAPIAMADALAAALPNVVAVHRLAGLSHYSTLAHVLGAYQQ
ncbi:alpha/beta hydrolase [Sphingomonas sp. AR_OL41]|uniref:alpha/beta fold hydrolase n=1 Tax=Sphingomonas sp. AR_OL41 TaxID=3042729 RepID=UPI0024809791|nr:alpha/beta hydrolase [Sphingomonas sp. AR_OL41]MDH7975242.1 alpha/beta hydrolase [Sphingomonas sp. AR_OL41]